MKKSKVYPAHLCITCRETTTNRHYCDSCRKLHMKPPFYQTSKLITAPCEGGSSALRRNEDTKTLR